MNTKLPAGTLDKLWGDSNNWRGDILYICKDDPRLIVPKRQKWGRWTINFAHPSAWVLLLVVILTAVIPAIFLAGVLSAGVGIAYGVGFVIAYCVGFVILACALSAILSSPKWYENAG
jgi:hypothetical protein